MNKVLALRWIPVTERLPNVGDTYIVTIEYKGEFEGVDAADFVFTGDGYIDGKWDTLNDWIEDKPEFYHVTAWMPLPEPYGFLNKFIKRTETHECVSKECGTVQKGENR